MVSMSKLSPGMKIRICGEEELRKQLEAESTRGWSEGAAGFKMTFAGKILTVRRVREDFGARCYESVGGFFDLLWKEEMIDCIIDADYTEECSEDTDMQEFLLSFMQ